MEAEGRHFFPADRPIERLDEDRLFRRGFAESVANAIRNWRGHESLVMALYGGWGDGKSSVKGMVIDALKQAPDKCPYLVEFNPWEWAGQHQLSQVFFEEIGKQIAHQGKGSEKKGAADCGRRLQSLGKYLNLAGAFMSPLGFAANLVFPFASLVTDAAAKALKQSGELADIAREALREKQERESSTLHSEKLALKLSLEGLRRNIVVMIDDVDRLTADEIKLLFQLVKANTDFPNLIFFLFFQRDIVETALGRTVGTGTGRDYLEKIVQVPLTLPTIHKSQLELLICSKLNKLIVTHKLGASFDWSRFRLLLRNGVGGYFRNLRDVVRFFGTYEFHIATFHSPLEFDAVDLFALEALRQFDPGVYNQLAAWSHPLESKANEPGEMDFQPVDVTEPWKRTIKSVLDSSAASRPDVAKELLEELFPVETFALGLRSPEKLISIQRRAGVGHPAYFRRYFQLCIPQGDVPQAEVIDLLKAIPIKERFSDVLRHLDKRGLALEALSRLCAYSEDFDSKNASQVAAALFSAADELTGKYSSDLWNGISASACLVIEAHLNKLPSAADRFKVLIRAFQSASGLYLPTVLLGREAARQADAAKKTKGFSYESQVVALTNEQLDTLATVCARHISRAADDGRLAGHPKLKELLLKWRRWQPKGKKVTNWFRRLVSKDDGLILVLEQFLGTKLSGDLKERFFDSYFDRGLSELEVFMPPQKLKKLVDRLYRSSISERAKALCLLFERCFVEHSRTAALFGGTGNGHSAESPSGASATSGGTTISNPEEE